MRLQARYIGGTTPANRSTVMKPVTRMLSGVAIATALMYWLDPASGRRRRAQWRDKFRSAARRTGRAVEAAARDLAHRVQGLSAQARSKFNHGPVNDDVLTERTRSMLGRLVSHPGAIEVSVRLGRVELRGAVLAAEHGSLMKAAQALRGVRGVDDRLAVHEDSHGISALQGGRLRGPPRFELLQERWSPAARLLMGTTALGLIGYGVRNRSLGGVLSSAAGGALFLRSTMNLPLSRLAGVGGDTIKIQKTLHVNAPVEHVFAALTNYENFPYFMRNVRHVRSHPDGRSHWSVAGPAGTTVEWDAETTQLEPNELIAWRSVRHAMVQHSGSIRFQSENGGTCLEIRMSYSPPAGILGHGVAKLFGVDPKRELDEDLLRLKSYLETGNPPHDSAAARAAQTHAAQGTAPEPSASTVPFRTEQSVH
jgi:uncharacterized membrane protein